MANRVSATTLFAAMREQGHPDPELTAGDSYFRVTLPVRSADRGLKSAESSEG